MRKLIRSLRLWWVRPADEPEWVETGEHNITTDGRGNYRSWVPDGSGTVVQTTSLGEARLLAKGNYTNRDGIVVCYTCGGNCGQCGTSVGMGVQPSMQRIVDNLHRGGPGV